MIDYTTREATKCDDDKVYFTDGILYIISRKLDECFKWKCECDEIILSAEYDEPISLRDIEMKYPDVFKVVYDDALHGKVYNFGNHRGQKTCTGEPCELWECVGETRGYA
jgi:hypothetical protein